MKIIARYILMLMLAGTAGYLSSYLHMLGFWFTGADLAVALSIGVVIINIRNNNSSQQLPTKSIITIGCICGLLAGIFNEILINLLYTGYREFEDQFIDIASCIAYGGALIHAYSQYSRYIVDQFYNTLMHVIKAALLMVIIRTGIYSLMSLPPDKDPGVTCGFTTSELAIIEIFFIIAGTIPFSLAWFFAMTISDPMWDDDAH